MLVEKEFSTTDTEVCILYNCKRWKLPYDVQSMIKFGNKECILEKKNWGQQQRAASQLEVTREQRHNWKKQQRAAAQLVRRQQGNSHTTGGICEDQQHSWRQRNRRDISTAGGNCEEQQHSCRQQGSSRSLRGCRCSR